MIVNCLYCGSSLKIRRNTKRYCGGVCRVRGNRKNISVTISVTKPVSVTSRGYKIVNEPSLAYQDN